MTSYQFGFELVPSDGSAWISKQLTKKELPRPSFMGELKTEKELASGARLDLFGYDTAADAVSENHIYGSKEKSFIDLYFVKGFLENITCVLDLRGRYEDTVCGIVKCFSEINCAFRYEGKVYPLTEEYLEDRIKLSKAYQFVDSPDEFFGTSGERHLDKLNKMIVTEVPVSVKESDMDSEKAKLLISLGIPREDIEFFSMYGEGSFGDYFRFISPFSENWEGLVDDQRDIYNFLKTSEIEDCGENETFVYNFWPEDNGLLPWAQTDDSTFYWRINGGRVTAIVVDDDDFVEYENMSVTEFMYKMFCGQLEEPGIPCDLFENGIFLDILPDESADSEYDDIELSPEEKRSAIQMESYSPDKEQLLRNMLDNMKNAGVPREMIEIFKQQSGIDDD